jgi:hypothetical protein
MFLHGAPAYSDHLKEAKNNTWRFFECSKLWKPTQDQMGWDLARLTVRESCCGLSTTVPNLDSKTIFADCRP